MLTPSNEALAAGWFDKLPTSIPINPPSTVVNIVGLATVVLLIYLAAWWLNKPRHKLGENEMAKDFRNTRVRFFVGEGITNFVEDGVADHKITRAESIDVYTKIGKAFGLDDLLPRKKPRLKLSFGEQQHLKEKIKERSPHLVLKTNVVAMPVIKKRVFGSK